MNQVDYILLSSKSSHEALKSLYNFQKQKQPTFSLTILGKKLGISSKGHISDMIRGRRSISRKHWSVLSQVFDLSETQTHYFHCLLEKDHSKCAQQRSYFERQLQSLESMINSRFDSRTLPKVEAPTKSAIEVIEAFNLFNGRPSFRDLLDYFGRHRYREIENTLSFLLEKGFVQEVNGVYFQSQRSQSIQEALDSETDYLKASFIEGCEQIDQYEDRPDQAVFTSEVLCLSQKDYLDLVQEMKAFLAKAKQKTNQGEADQLVKVNLQLYPLGMKI